jgi:hypothetical protein
MKLPSINRSFSEIFTGKGHRKDKRLNQLLIQPLSNQKPNPTKI